MKQVLRQHLKEKRLQLKEPKRAHALLNIIEKLLMQLKQIPQLGDSNIIAGYYPLPGELDMLKVMQQLTEMGYKLALPCIRDKSLEFKAWQMGQKLVASQFATKEPVSTALLVEPSVILVPLLGFDNRCNRLGYGGGYYDRVALNYPLAVRIGLAYNIQEVPRMPVEKHDVPLDMIITETNIILTQVTEFI